MPKNIYKNSKGEVLPGVSTIANLLGKGEAIPSWSHKVAYDSTVKLIREAYKKHKKLIIPKYEEIETWQSRRDNAGDIGILAHALAMTYWTKEDSTPILQGYTLGQCDMAQRCIDKLYQWTDLEDFEPILIEWAFVSEKHKVGGQADLYGYMKSTFKTRRIDIKTSGGIYDSYWIQLAGYDIIGTENGYSADEHQILWLPKDDRFDAPIRTDLRKEKQIFKNLLKIYYLRREL